LSGALDDARTDEDLDDAVTHGLNLLSFGVLTVEEVLAEAAWVSATG
jgi:hypothetical protein